MTGFGVIEIGNGRANCLAGAWDFHCPGGREAQEIHEGLQLIDEHRPDQVAIEKIFMARSATRR